MWIDTHVHFDGLKELGVAAAIGRAHEAGVGRMIAVGGSPEANTAALSVAAGNPAEVYAAVGLDRYCAGLSTSPAELERQLSEAQVVAVGEIGLDFHYQPETARIQEELFGQMLALARVRRLPVIVHCRESEAALLDHLRRHVNEAGMDAGRVGVLHCFTGTMEFARQILDLGFMVSFSGILSFRNADPLREVCRMIPDDRLLVETDSPFLAPVPMRGKMNEPAYVVHVGDVLARCRGCPVEKIAEITTANACRLFSLSPVVV